MSDKKSIVFYKDWWEACKGSPAELKEELYDAIFDYAFNGALPQSPAIAIAFNIIKMRIDADVNKWAEIREKRSEAGKKHKGNQYTQKKQNGTKWDKMEQTQTNGTDNVNVNANVNVDNNNVIYNNNVVNKFTTTSKRDFDATAFVEYWNKEVQGTQIPKINKLTERRKSQLQARIAEYGKDNVIKAIQLMKESNFLNGGGDKGFVCSVDWFLRPNNFPKVLEGNYTNTTKKGAQIALNQPKIDHLWHEDVRKGEITIEEWKKRKSNNK